MNFETLFTIFLPLSLIIAIADDTTPVAIAQISSLLYIN